MPRIFKKQKGGACYSLLDIVGRVKRWLDSIENKRPAIYTDTCIGRTDIADDGLCFYNALLTALGKNSGGTTQNEIDNSQQLARYIAEWLEINKDTVIPVAGGMRLEDAMPTNEIPQHLRERNSIPKKFSFKDYIKETINFQGIAPNVYPELEVSGWAAANVLNVNIKVFIDNQNTTYTPLAVGSVVPTISLFNTGNHFELCRPQGGGNYLRKYKMGTRKQKGGACYKLLETGSVPNLGPALKDKPNTQPAENARRAALTPQQRAAEDKMKRIHERLASLGYNPKNVLTAAPANSPVMRAINSSTVTRKNKWTQLLTEANETQKEYEALKNERDSIERSLKLLRTASRAKPENKNISTNITEKNAELDGINEDLTKIKTRLEEFLTELKADPATPLIKAAITSIDNTLNPATAPATATAPAPAPAPALTIRNPFPGAIGSLFASAPAPPRDPALTVRNPASTAAVPPGLAAAPPSLPAGFKASSALGKRLRGTAKGINARATAVNPFRTSSALPPPPLPGLLQRTVNATTRKQRGGSKKRRTKNLRNK